MRYAKSPQTAQVQRVVKDSKLPSGVSNTQSPSDKGDETLPGTQNNGTARQVDRNLSARRVAQRLLERSIRSQGDSFVASQRLASSEMTASHRSIRRIQWIAG